MPASEPLLVLEQIELRWPHGPMFAALDWRVPAGAALVQGGPGSGKTTLLRLLAGTAAPTRGQVLLHGAPVQPAQVFWPERDAAGTEQMVVRDWWRAVAARCPAWDPSALERHVAGFTLEAHQNKGFFMLSTGSRRKAWFAAALASGAPLTLIDEPLAGLDLASRRYLSTAIADAAQQAGRVIVVAHDAPLADVPWTALLALPDRE
ncbi:MAG: ATP-binding cassette domain-containing protein [Simplicispira suum]|uniref:ABC transporter ATP-binding protein n=1 Tax=Simplicispira suum TaxID=2109915 RepID=UPI001C6CB3C0|nr:ATP-binding cassette domain-containing protein [Simplicispira suum]MBW7833086.1 ATP-binding cassette domain-containing protein [Simplicispira suum]